jgi:hypothetical protein
MDVFANPVSQRLRNFAGDPNVYVRGLRLLQDLCSVSGELPSSFWLDHINVDRHHIVGRGGEACVFAGSFRGQRIAVREVIIPHKHSWRSPEGKNILMAVPLFIS